MMDDEQLTAIIATRVLGWRVAPGRFIKEGRTWIPMWRFSPLTQLADAFDLLDSCEAHYAIEFVTGGAFVVHVRIAGRVGTASGLPKARTITVALARALGLLQPSASAATCAVPNFAPVGGDRGA